MNNHEAQSLLAAYRPNGRDAGHLEFQEALRLAALDPELSRKFAEQQAFDIHAAAALRMLAVPTNKLPFSETDIPLAPPAASFLRSRMLLPLGLAAGIALVTGIIAWSQSAYPLPLPTATANTGISTVAPLTAFANFLTGHKISLEFTDNDYTRVQAWLAYRHDPVPFNLPSGFAPLAAIGCQAWETPTGKVSLVCFIGLDRKSLHLYVFDNPAALGVLPDRTTPEFGRLDKWVVAAWQDQHHAYVVSLADDRTPQSALSGLWGS